MFEGGEGVFFFVLGFVVEDVLLCGIFILGDYVFFGNDVYGGMY